MTFVALGMGTVKNNRHCGCLMPQEQNWFGSGFKPTSGKPFTWRNNGAIPCPAVKLVTGSLIRFVGIRHGSYFQRTLPEYWNFTSARTFCPLPDIAATTPGHRYLARRGAQGRNAGQSMASSRNRQL